VKVNNMPSLFHIMRYGNDQGSSYKAGIWITFFDYQ
jgi:hypothetical protein